MTDSNVEQGQPAQVQATPKRHYHHRTLIRHTETSLSTAVDDPKDMLLHAKLRLVADDPDGHAMLERVYRGAMGKPIVPLAIDKNTNRPIHEYDAQGSNFEI